MWLLSAILLSSSMSNHFFQWVACDKQQCDKNGGKKNVRFDTKTVQGAISQMSFQSLQLFSQMCIQSEQMAEQYDSAVAAGVEMPSVVWNDSHSSAELHDS